MARPLRFRHAPGQWNAARIHSEIFTDLDQNIGAIQRRPWYKTPESYDGVRFEMQNGDIAIFAYNHEEAYWLGNTQTPECLWRTEKYGFAEVDNAISRWATRELTAQLHQETPWLEPYPHLSWFFLPVFLSKDGRETTRQFFDAHAGGFPDAERDAVLSFYESFFRTRVLDPYREVMAGKLGTSEYLDLRRMTAAMGEFNAAALLTANGHDIEPEITVSSGHAIDYRVYTESTNPLVEVTRPSTPANRSAATPIAALRETAETKTSGQLQTHDGEVILCIDCSSFHDDEWRRIYAEKPDIHHRPALVFRSRPTGRFAGYTKGQVPLDLPM